MSDNCIKHGVAHDNSCPYCAVVVLRKLNEEAEAKLDKFYNWFRSMSRDQVDAMLEKQP